MTAHEPVPILLVNAHSDELDAITAALAPLGEILLRASSAHQALALAGTQPFAAAIVGFELSDMEGVALAGQLRAREYTRDLPIVFVGGAPSMAALDRLYALHAVDYVPAPLAPAPLRAKIATFLELQRKNAALRRHAARITLAADASIDEHQERFRLLLEAASDYALFFTDTEGVIREWTTSAQHLLGYTEAEIVGQHLASIFTDEDRQAGAPALELQNAALDGQSRDERWHRRRDGSVFITVGRLVALRRRDGTIRGFAKILRDATQQKAAEELLREREQQLRLAIEAAELGTFFHDLSGNRLVHSARTNRLLGLPADHEVSAETLLHCIHPDDRGRVAQTLASRRQESHNRDDLTLEYRVVWPDGTIHHLAAASRLLVGARSDGSNSVNIVGTLRDVTSAKEFEQELRNKVAERTAAFEEKTAQLESFCYTVAHDLRSPLRAISGYAEVVLEDYGKQLPQGASAYLDKIKASAHRLDSLIKDLLAYSRITQIDVALDDVPVQASVDWALQELRPEITAKHAVVVVAASLPCVRGERTILDQVLLNLISNAVKFVPAGTTPHIEVTAAARDGFVRLAVRDNGIGIDAAYHARIFRVFERLQQARDFPGTGVGLAIVAKAAERLGGRVGVESQPGHGSLFWIDLQEGRA